MYEAIYQIARNTEYKPQEQYYGLAPSDTTYRLENLLSGEIREAKDFETILRSLARDHGFYLRPVK